MKRFALLTGFAILCTLMLPSCSSKFLAADFYSKTANHKKIAVLPVETVLSGNQPKKLSAAQIKSIEEAESKAFQTSLYNCLLKKSGAGKNDIKIEIQPIEKTNSLLSGAGIDIRKAWSMESEALCKTLGVDAVVKTKVEKTRYMSDLASYGISLGQDILLALTDYSVWPLVPSGMSKTNDIKADCSLLNENDGSLLWRVAVQTETDWSRPSNQIIDELNRKFARNFPYTK